MGLKVLSYVYVAGMIDKCEAAWCHLLERFNQVVGDKPLYGLLKALDPQSKSDCGPVNQAIETGQIPIYCFTTFFRGT